LCLVIVAQWFFSRKMQR